MQMSDPCWVYFSIKYETSVEVYLFIYLFLAYRWLITPAPFAARAFFFFFSIEFLCISVKFSWTYWCGSTSGLSVLLHWSVCLSIHQYLSLNYGGLVIFVSLKSRRVILALYFSFQKENSIFSSFAHKF